MILADFLTHFPTYIIAEKPTAEVLASYQGLVPADLLAVWQEYGFGTFCEGYLKIVNPDDYADLLAATYQLTSLPAEVSPLVVFATAMGDLIVWERGYLVMVNYRYGQANVVGKHMGLFFKNLADKEYKEDKLAYTPYPTARLRLGEPAFDECFGYVPLLALGGQETAEHLEKVKLQEHIALIGEFVGPIER